MAFGDDSSLLDNFNRSNEDPMTGWTDVVDGWEVVANEAAPGQANQNLSVYAGSTFGPDQECYVDVQRKPNNNDSIGLFVQYVSGPDGYIIHWLARSGAGSDELEFHRVDDGSATQLGSDTIDEYATADKVGASITNGNPEAWRDDGGGWTQIDTRTDGTYDAISNIGLYGWDATADGDNFYGGTIVVSAGQPTMKRMQGVPTMPGSRDRAGRWN